MLVPIKWLNDFVDVSGISPEELADKFLEAVHINEPEVALDMYKNYVGLTGETIGGDLAWCENEVNLGRKPTHMYFLTIVPPGAEFAHHSAEHHYVFQTLVRSKRPYTGRDWDLSNTLADYWANFIKTGDSNDGKNPQWDAYTADNKKALEINYDLRMIEVPANDYVKFIRDYDLMK